MIKIERPPGGDFARHYDSVVSGYSAHFVWLNRGKKSVSLDLKSPDGRNAFVKLLSSSDVLVANLSPGALERIVPDAEMQHANPRLIRCYITGYGPDGPYRDRKAYDLLIQGEAGVTRSTGTPDQPAKPGVSLADLAGGVYALAAINAALANRQTSGVGVHIDVSLFDVVAEWMMPLLLATKSTGRPPDPVGTRHATIVPYGPFETADGQTINVAVQTEGQWRALCDVVLDDGELASDPRYGSNEQRVRNRESVEADVGACIRRLDRDVVRARLNDAGVPWGNLNDLTDVISHPQLVERGRWVQTELPSGESAEVLDHPFLMSGVPSSNHSRVPSVGEHTAEVLLELGFSKGQLLEMGADQCTDAQVPEGVTRTVRTDGARSGKV